MKKELKLDHKQDCKRRKNVVAVQKIRNKKDINGVIRMVFCLNNLELYNLKAKISIKRVFKCCKKVSYSRIRMQVQKLVYKVKIRHQIC